MAVAFAAIGTVLFTGSLFAPAARGDDALNERVAQLVEPYIQGEIAVGLSVGLIRGDEVTIRHFGRVADDGPAPDDRTLYEIGSISKVFTALLLADAARRGEVKLVQPAQELAPEGLSIPILGEQPIRLVDLSTHRSGLPRMPDNFKSENPADPYASYTSRELIDFLKSHRLTRKPGEKYEYSNLAVSLLGHLLCVKAGEPYEKLLRERVTGPLGMADTMISLGPKDARRLATPHAAAGVATLPWNFADIPGAGGVRSTVRDMLTFCLAQLNPPDSEIGRAIDLAFEKQVDGDAQSPAMCLGWHLLPDGKTRMHNGQTGGSHALVLVNRQSALAVVLLSNTATMEIDGLGNDLMQTLAGQKVQPKKIRAAVNVPEAIKKRYVGRYEFAPGVTLTVTLTKGRLMAQLTGQSAFPIYAASETQWFYRIVEAELTFKLDDKKKAVSVELFQNGARQVAKRVGD